MARARAQGPEDRLAAYERLVATNPKAERKGATMPYTSLNGHMFSFLTKAGTLALRLPETVREAFIEKYGAKTCVQHGAVMKEYVEVPDALLANTRALKKYFDASYAYVASLDPKPSSPKRKAARRR
jgi:TfoX/Sxy family transcriptional regulator of competence genes